MSIRCMCVDDEPLARKGLAMALEPFEDFELVACFAAADEALAKLPADIDVVFLDIEMPRQDGFAMLGQWPGPLPLVVFVTAYDQYAVKAFEEQALDYVLKPIDETRFAGVIARIRGALTEDTGRKERLLQTIASLKQKLKRDEATMTVKADDGYFRIKLADLLYVESVGDLVCLHLAGRQLITRATLKQYVADLSEQGFYQIHKSFLVNARHVVRVSKLRFGDHQVVLSNQKELRLSRRYRSALEAFTS